MVKQHIDTEESVISINGTAIEGINPGSIPFPKPTRATKNVTTIKDKIQRKGVKILDPGKASFSGIKIPGDPGQIALQTAADATIPQEVTIQISVTEAGLVYEYQAFVATSYEGTKDDDTLTFTCDLEVTGGFVRTATFAAITSIEGTAASVAYSPNVANTALPSTAKFVIFKEVTGTTTDTVEVTAAAASYIGISYDDGLTWVTLTSGVAGTFSSTYWPAAANIAKAIIKVSEALKATRFVTLLIARA